MHRTWLISPLQGVSLWRCNVAHDPLAHPDEMDARGGNPAARAEQIRAGIFGYGRTVKPSQPNGANGCLCLKPAYADPFPPAVIRRDRVGIARVGQRA